MKEQTKNSWEGMPDDVSGYVGFVYLIENKINNKKYIGKKLFRYKYGKRVRKSEWENYFGSSKELLEDIKKYGEKNFTRKVLKLCKTKTEWSYEELKYQVENNVLFDDNYYNKLIRVRIKSPTK